MSEINVRPRMSVRMLLLLLEANPKYRVLVTVPRDYYNVEVSREALVKQLTKEFIPDGLVAVRLIHDEREFHLG